MLSGVDADFDSSAKFGVLTIRICFGTFPLPLPAKLHIESPIYRLSATRCLRHSRGDTPCQRLKA